MSGAPRYAARRDASSSPRVPRRCELESGESRATRCRPEALETPFRRFLSRLSTLKTTIRRPALCAARISSTVPGSIRGASCADSSGSTTHVTWALPLEPARSPSRTAIAHEVRRLERRDSSSSPPGGARTKRVASRGARCAGAARSHPTPVLRPRQPCAAIGRAARLVRGEGFRARVRTILAEALPIARGGRSSRAEVTVTRRRRPFQRPPEEDLLASLLRRLLQFPRVRRLDSALRASTPPRRRVASQ